MIEIVIRIFKALGIVILSILAGAVAGAVAVALAFMAMKYLPVVVIIVFLSGMVVMKYNEIKEEEDKRRGFKKYMRDKYSNGER